MNNIAQHIHHIHQLCDQHKVKRLYIFGSIISDNFQPGSDIDFIVDFEPQDVKLYADNYFKLKFALQDTLNRPIDLI